LAIREEDDCKLGLRRESIDHVKQLHEDTVEVCATTSIELLDDLLHSVEIFLVGACEVIGITIEGNRDQFLERRAVSVQYCVQNHAGTLLE